MEPKIILENENFIAVNKPAGLLVHSPKTKSPKLKAEFTLVDFLVKKYPEIKKVGDDPEIRPGIVHRLDKDTSGVILIARNQKYFQYLKNLFQTGQIKKTYIALVYGKIEPQKGVIEKPIGLKPGTTKRTVFGGKMIKEAITEYEVIQYYELPPSARQSPRESMTFSLLKVEPKTGRTHQIRIHLASINHPVVGDQLYTKRENPFGLTRQFLHAQSLEFPIEQGKRIKIEADLPDDLQKIINSLES